MVVAMRWEIATINPPEMAFGEEPERRAES